MICIEVLHVFKRLSPGGCNIEGEDESWDFGTGAGFYVDATEDPWKKNYRMYSYITEEVRVIHIIRRIRLQCKSPPGWQVVYLVGMLLTFPLSVLLCTQFFIIPPVILALFFSRIEHRRNSVQTSKRSAHHWIRELHDTGLLRPLTGTFLILSGRFQL